MNVWLYVSPELVSMGIDQPPDLEPPFNPPEGMVIWLVRRASAMYLLGMLPVAFIAAMIPLPYRFSMLCTAALRITYSPVLASV